jgi:hypothetical protein
LDNGVLKKDQCVVAKQIDFKVDNHWFEGRIISVINVHDRFGLPYFYMEISVDDWYPECVIKIRDSSSITTLDEDQFCQHGLHAHEYFQHTNIAPVDFAVFTSTNNFYFHNHHNAKNTSSFVKITTLNYNIISTEKIGSPALLKRSVAFEPCQFKAVEIVKKAIILDNGTNNTLFVQDFQFIEQIPSQSELFERICATESFDKSNLLESVNMMLRKNGDNSMRSYSSGLSSSSRKQFHEYLRNDHQVSVIVDPNSTAGWIKLQPAIPECLRCYKWTVDIYVSTKWNYMTFTPETANILFDLYMNNLGIPELGILSDQIILQYCELNARGSNGWDEFVGAEIVYPTIDFQERRFTKECKLKKHSEIVLHDYQVQNVKLMLEIESRGPWTQELWIQRETPDGETYWVSQQLRQFRFTPPCQRGKGGILADAAGLGKTITSLALIQKDKIENNFKPTLIVVPSHLIDQWFDEFETYSHRSLKILKLFRRSSPSLEELQKYNVILTTYSTLDKLDTGTEK